MESLQIGRALGKWRHEATVMESLATLLERTNPRLGQQAREVAEKMMKPSRSHQSQGDLNQNTRRRRNLNHRNRQRKTK